MAAGSTAKTFERNPASEYGDIQSSTSFFLRHAVPLTATILDVGTNRGSLLNELAAHNYTDLYGIDINADAIENGKRSYPKLAGRLQACDGARIPFPDSTFDVVTLFDVLEHLPKPVLSLQEIRRVLKPGGQLLFQTPNILTNIPWVIIVNRSLTSWKTNHCSLQTLTSLRRILRKSGFHNVHIEKVSPVSPHKLARITKIFGVFGGFLLRTAALMPLFLSTNFWGSCTR